MRSRRKFIAAAASAAALGLAGCTDGGQEPGTDPRDDENGLEDGDDDPTAGGASPEVDFLYTYEDDELQIEHDIGDEIDGDRIEVTSADGEELTFTDPFEDEVTSGMQATVDVSSLEEGDTVRVLYTMDDGSVETLDEHVLGEE